MICFIDVDSMRIKTNWVGEIGVVSTESDVRSHRVHDQHFEFVGEIHEPKQRRAPQQRPGRRWKFLRLRMLENRNETLRKHRGVHLVKPPRRVPDGGARVPLVKWRTILPVCGTHFALRASDS